MDKPTLRDKLAKWFHLRKHTPSHWSPPPCAECYEWADAILQLVEGRTSDMFTEGYQKGAASVQAQLDIAIHAVDDTKKMLNAVELAASTSVRVEVLKEMLEKWTSNLDKSGPSDDGYATQSNELARLIAAVEQRKEAAASDTCDCDLQVGFLCRKHAAEANAHRGIDPVQAIIAGIKDPVARREFLDDIAIHDEIILKRAAPSEAAIRLDEHTRVCPACHGADECCPRGKMLEEKLAKS